MSDSEILLKAAINRISARISDKVRNSAQELNEIAEEIPNRVQSEWSSFKEEVIEEYERLSKNKTNTSKEKKSNQDLTKEALIQTKIDNLRSKVININKQIEEKN